MKSAYLIYRPVLDYEESETPYLITRSEERAKEIVEEIVGGCQKIASQLSPCSHIENIDEWSELEEQNSQILNRVQWPYGIKQSKFDFRETQRGNNETDKYEHTCQFDNAAIAYKELPLID